MLAVYVGLCLALFTLYFVGILVRSFRRPETGLCYFLQDITVLIPFRNEGEQLEALLNSLLVQAQNPYQIILIDDHSEDHSLDVIARFQTMLPLKVVQLPSHLQGKKQALRYPFPEIKTRYILTLDADVTLHKDYFVQLENTVAAPLTILPVRMLGYGFPASFYELDYYYLFNLQRSFGVTGRFVVASGANLLLDLSILRQIDSIGKHAHIPSGDDQYVLEDFARNGYHIHDSYERKLCVDTPTPNTFKQFLEQRRRWLKKTSSLRNPLAIALGLMGICYHIGALVLVIFSGNVKTMLLLVGSKILIDTCIFLPTLFGLGRIKNALYLPLFSILYPLYLVLMLVPIGKGRQIWKGRKY